MPKLTVFNYLLADEIHFFDETQAHILWWAVYPNTWLTAHSKIARDNGEFTCCKVTE
jgi:hypothetical protein